VYNYRDPQDGWNVNNVQIYYNCMGKTETLLLPYAFIQKFQCFCTASFFTSLRTGNGLNTLGLSGRQIVLVYYTTMGEIIK